MRYTLLILGVAMLLALTPSTHTYESNKVDEVEEAVIVESNKEQLNILVRDYLNSKQSPLAPDTEFLLEQKHWKLLVAISAIESQYCKRQLGYNCWGIGGDSSYRHYSSYRAAITDANDLIERWQQRGRWLTVEDMNCHYVVPCNPNWVNVVHKVLKEMDEYERQSTGTIHQQES